MLKNVPAKMRKEIVALNKKGIEVKGTGSRKKVFGVIEIKDFHVTAWPIVRADNGKTYEISYDLMNRLLDGEISAIRA